MTTADRPPTDDDHPLVREYPELPDEMTRASAADYATAFEEAYQLNRLAERPSASAYRVEEVYHRESNAVADGFVVSFELSLAWQTESNGQTVAADGNVAVTYFVSNRTVIRHEGSTEGNPRTEAVGEVVVCRGPE